MNWMDIPYNQKYWGGFIFLPLGYAPSFTPGFMTGKNPATMTTGPKSGLTDALG